MVHSTDRGVQTSIQSDGDDILESLIAIGRATRKRLDAGAEVGSHWLLHVLSRCGPLRARDLAQACGLDSSTVSRHLRQLQDDGLVERRPDPDDGRAHLVSLSAAGADTAAATRDERRRIILDRLADWPTTDVQALAALLSRLAAEVGAGAESGVLLPDSTLSSSSALTRPALPTKDATR